MICGSCRRRTAEICWMREEDMSRSNKISEWKNNERWGLERRGGKKGEFKKTAAIKTGQCAEDGPWFCLRVEECHKVVMWLTGFFSEENILDEVSMGTTVHYPLCRKTIQAQNYETRYLPLRTELGGSRVASLHLLIFWVSNSKYADTCKDHLLSEARRKNKKSQCRTW